MTATAAGGGAKQQGRSRVGSLRPSQLLHTFGVGAVTDLPHLSVMVLGLDLWDTSYAEQVGEERLLAALRAQHGPQVEALRSPPFLPETDNPFDPWTRVGVPVAVFPRWLRCTNQACRLLAPIERGLFQLKVNPFRHDQARYEHHCVTRGKPPSAVPARFLIACRNGHLDDFPWEQYAHGGKPCGNPLLQLVEFGATGEAADVRVVCKSCREGRSMALAFGKDAKGRLPRCRGRRPHLADFEDKPCREELRTIGLGASNLWFADVTSVLSIPSHAVALAQRVEELWPHLEDIDGAKMLAYAIKNVQELAPLRGYEPEEVLAAIDERRAGLSAADEAATDIHGPEWDVLSSPESVPAGMSEHFRARVGAVPDVPLLKGKIEQVVLVDRLREVMALTGFTRIDTPGEVDADGKEPARVRLTRNSPRWFPCAETRGEGLFIRFPLDEIGRWEQRVAGHARIAEFRDASGSSAWSLWPGQRYVLLHTLSHALIREVALECGYGAASIRERLYASTGHDATRAWAGILLYTAAPDSEGTLGGLVSLGQPEILGRLLSDAIEHARLCSADPMCAEHAPGDGGALHGAACHACLFAAETSCERGNRFLDRSLLVDTFTHTGLGYVSS